ncbi:maltose/maltodextrin ABC transporter [Vibrio ishigakensis]|uniref:Maltose/maltodextrin ABC transporter n=1 Tax=Vibrio ishigakensis TaxID=1481914 RepID=A0A0B8Q307_9VIBR|nr:maltose/maltodextrin ABC transporter [Vibrio ishigakensis]
MQTVQSSGSVETPPVAGNTKAVLKWATLGLVGIVNGYATILMYSRGEVAFALLTLIITALALYIFGSKKTYAHRYIYPGIADDFVHLVPIGVHGEPSFYKLQCKKPTFT